MIEKQKNEFDTFLCNYFSLKNNEKCTPWCLCKLYFKLIAHPSNYQRKILHYRIILINDFASKYCIRISIQDKIIHGLNRWTHGSWTLAQAWGGRCVSSHLVIAKYVVLLDLMEYEVHKTMSILGKKTQLELIKLLEWMSCLLERQKQEDKCQQKEKGADGPRTRHSARPGLRFFQEGEGTMKL